MAGDQNDGMSADRSVSANISGSQGVQAGEGSTQVNIFVSAGDAGARPVAGRKTDGPTGWLLDALDPFELEVHRPVEPDEPVSGLAVLPGYVERDHDRELAELARAAAGGTSGIGVLVGGSSTGKTRAGWEVLELLRGRAPAWRLWHPIAPSRAEATLEGLASVEPRTVIWLNEAQHYLQAPGGMGEQVAAGLRELLRDKDRGPVLLLATLWPEYWSILTRPPSPGEDDPHAAARDLLGGHAIRVPGAFSDEQVRAVAESPDPRLAAAARAPEGEVTQFLAGAPALSDYYDHAPPAARALLDAAIDARRLGMSIDLPRAFLRDAAPGYLTGAQWAAIGGKWEWHFAVALDDTARESKGVLGPLIPVIPLPASPSPRPGEACRLADYLEQQGRRTRRSSFPPSTFWTAAASHASPGDLPALARAAESRGLLRDAACLRRRAADGNAFQAAALIRDLYALDPNSLGPESARWVGAHAPLDNPRAVASILWAVRRAGAAQQATGLVQRNPAASVSLDNPDAVASLLSALREVGAAQQATALVERNPAASVSLDRVGGVASLLRALRAAGAAQQVPALADRAAVGVPLSDPGAVGTLLSALHKVGAAQQVTMLADRAAAGIPLDQRGGIAPLLMALGKVGAGQQVTALADRAALGVFLGDPGAVASLLSALHKVGAAQQVTALTARNPAHAAPLDHPVAVASLLLALRAVGAAQQATALADRAAIGVPLGDPGAVATLLSALRRAGALRQVTTLTARNPADGVLLDHPGAVGTLLSALRRVGAVQQVTKLADRAAIGVPLGDPGALATLLDALRGTGAAQQATALADRAAGGASLDDPGAVASLLDALHKAGAVKQREILVSRLTAEGRFDLFRKELTNDKQYRFGRQSDGKPAPEWTWGDLDTSVLRPSRT